MKTKLTTLFSASSLACALSFIQLSAHAQGSSNSGSFVALATLSVLAAPVGSAMVSGQGQNPINDSVAAVAGAFLITAMSA